MNDVPENLYKCNIETVIKYFKRFKCDIYIKISPDKTLKLSHKNDDYVDTLIKYRSKGLDFVYMEEAEYNNFLKYYKDTLKQISLSHDSTEKNIEEFDIGYELIKESAINIGLNQTNIEIAQEINKQAIVSLKKEKKIFDLIRELKSRSGDEFVKNILSGYVASSILNYFPWQTNILKEKVSMAILLKDITLNAEEICLMNSARKDNSKLSNKIRNHPIAISEMLDNYPSLVSNDLLTMIEQHHELPDGSGYPRSLDYKLISPISAIMIISIRFVDLLFSLGPDKIDITTILSQLSKEFSKGIFKKTFKTLKTALQ